MRNLNQKLFNQAVDLYGTQTALAEDLGITKGAVSQWKDKGIPKPWVRVLQMLLKEHKEKALSEVV